MDIVKASFNLPRAEFEALKELAERRSETATQALRQALVTEEFVQSLADRGAKLLVQEPGVDRDTLQEVMFAQTRMAASARGRT